MSRVWCSHHIAQCARHQQMIPIRQAAKLLTAYQWLCTSESAQLFAMCMLHGVSCSESGNLNTFLSVIGRLITKSSSPERCGIGRPGSPGPCSICCSSSNGWSPTRPCPHTWPLPHLPPAKRALHAMCKHAPYKLVFASTCCACHHMIYVCTTVPAARICMTKNKLKVAV